MSGPYIFIDELPDIQARDGMFFITGMNGVPNLVFTPHMFMATIQAGARAYDRWERERREVIEYPKGAPATKTRRRKA